MLESKSQPELIPNTTLMPNDSLQPAQIQAVNEDRTLALVCQRIQNPATDTSMSPSKSESTLALSPVPATPISDHHLFLSSINPSLSVYSALFKNGTMLGLQCGCPLPLISNPVDPSLIPSSLQPTQLQMSILHSQFIDRFPFPRLRDNMICLIGYIDEEDFLGDLFNLTSFTLTPGCAPWDPRAWKMGKSLG